MLGFHGLCSMVLGYSSFGETPKVALRGPRSRVETPERRQLSRILQISSAVKFVEFGEF
jgi:hypothetical protein